MMVAILGPHFLWSQEEMAVAWINMLKQIKTRYFYWVFISQKCIGQHLKNAHFLFCTIKSIKHLI